ncbi:MAG: hypothetical protein ACI80V_003126 [Rhodothermales bacterium]|jgi:hypothetical protein
MRSKIGAEGKNQREAGAECCSQHLERLDLEPARHGGQQAEAGHHADTGEKGGPEPSPMLVVERLVHE